MFLRRFAPAALVLAVLLGCAEGDETTIVAPDNGPTTPDPPGRAGPGPGPGAGDEGPPEDEDASVARQMERTIFDLVNAERAERDIPPLTWDEQLAEEARSWSREMQERGQLQHQDPQQLLTGLEGLDAVGENIFQSTGSLPAGRIHVGWMRSDGHRPNILEPAFDRLGVGVVCSDAGVTWATEHFGSTLGGERPDRDRDVPPEEPIVASAEEGPSCAGNPNLREGS